MNYYIKGLNEYVQIAGELNVYLFKNKITTSKIEIDIEPDARSYRQWMFFARSLVKFNNVLFLHPSYSGYISHIKELEQYPNTYVEPNLLLLRKTIINNPDKIYIIARLECHRDTSLSIRYSVFDINLPYFTIILRKMLIDNLLPTLP